MDVLRELEGIKPESKVVIAILKPNPKLPRTFSLGTTASSKVTVAVEELYHLLSITYSKHFHKYTFLLSSISDPLMPSLSSFLPRDNPGVFMSTMNAVIPIQSKTEILF